MHESLGLLGGNPPREPEGFNYKGDPTWVGNIFIMSIFHVLKGEIIEQMFSGGSRLLKVRYAGIFWFKLRASPEGGRPETVNDGWLGAMRRQ